MTIAQSINSMSDDQVRQLNRVIGKAFVKKIIITAVVTIAAVVAVEAVGNYIDKKTTDEAE